MRLMLRSSIAIAVSATALTILSSGLPSIAQEPSAVKNELKSKAKTGKRSFDPSRRVPMYFGQLGLTVGQKEAIYEVQGKHRPKIDALEKQIEEIRGQMLRECESLLTTAQKDLLEQRRAGISEDRPTSKAPAKPSS